MTKHEALTPHCEKVLALLSKSEKPLSAYDLLDKLRKHGIKAPPTVYRALETLMERGLVHRIESLGAFVACHEHSHSHTEEHAHTQFAVCRNCGAVEEICDAQLTQIIKKLAASLKFRIEREMLELMGLCKKCTPVTTKKA